jgi:CubicO group peptidase (beta-lactamase class C family)
MQITTALQAQIIHIPGGYSSIHKGINNTYAVESKFAATDTYVGRPDLNDQSIGSYSPYLDSILTLQMGTNHIPGLSACIIKAGTVQWIGTYGWAEIESGTPMDTATLFQIASVSKTITLTALMQLWENNMFNLDDDINNYLPWEVRNPGYPAEPLTFRQLCTHSSTIQDNWNIMSYYWGEDSPIPLGDYLYSYLNPAGSLYDPYANFYYNQYPGNYYSYSNIGIALVGFLVEEISGIPFSQFCHDGIFSRLDMSETFWFLSETDTTHMARPYTWNGTNYIPYPFYCYPDYPDGQLKTNVGQLARFLLSYMENGTFNNEEILEAATIDTILKVQIPDLNAYQGLVWHRGTIPGIGEVWGHDGGDYGFSIEIRYCPEEDIGLVLLTNGEVDSSIIRSIGAVLLHYAMDSIIITAISSLSHSVGNTFTIYPNPFSNSTTFSYKLAEQSKVKLQIFNCFGQQVAEPVNTIQLKGEQDVKWDNRNLPTGIYYYRIHMGSQVESGKMVKN